MNLLTLPMGLACVAAAVEKAGHAVSFLDLLFVKDIPGAVEDYHLFVKARGHRRLSS